MLKRKREPYPSDLTDAEWKILQPLIPGPAKLGRPPRYEKRAILNAIFYVVRAGCAWRMLAATNSAFALGGMHQPFFSHGLSAFF